MKQIFTERLRGDRALQMHLRKGFALDPSCKLWLPFCKYGSEQAKIYDQSGNNNHGTITGAVPYPGNPVRTGVGSTFNRGDFTATNAFLWSSLDLSPYAGTDLGSTPYYIELLDGAGKKATGYLAAVGVGETLGSELVTNGSFETDPNVQWTPISCTIASIMGGQSGNCLQMTVVAGVQQYINQYVTTFIKALYKFSAYIKSGTSGDEPYLIYLPLGMGYFFGVSSGVWVQGSKYNNAQATLEAFQIYKNSITAGTMLFDEASLKRIVDPPSTAVHIVSSLNGTTRNWATIESGFNPNTITSWKIDSVIPKTAIGWYFDDVDDRIVHTSINFGKTHTLLYWLQSFANAKDIIHGGAANNHVAIDGTNIYYNAGATELSQAHGGGMGNSTMVGIVRSGTTVQFFKNGIQVGTDQTLDANNDLTLTTLGSYNTPGSFLGGVILHTIGFNRALSAQEIRDYYELTRSRYGV
jgi:hypothetical protein